MKRILLTVTGILAPAMAAHTLSTLSGAGVSIFVVALLESLGYGFLVATLRPKTIVALSAAVLYFPLVFGLIFQIGVSAGYYDLP